MRRDAKRNRIIIIFLLGVLFLMGVGYAAFQTKLTITGTGNISGEWNVKITNVEVAEEYGGGENVVTDFTLTTAELEANLYDKGDYVLYNITVENAGTFDAKLESLNLRQSTNDAVLITSSGFIKGEVLEKHSQKTLQVKIEYNSNYDGEDPAGTSGMAEVQLDFVQNSGGTIMPAQDYLLTYDYTTNGGTSTDAENAYLQEGSNVNLNYIAEKENYKFLGWNTNPSATEGLQSLTMPGNKLTLYAIFEYIDVTPPIINNVSTSSTTNSITVVTTATEEEGEIARYEYSIDNGEHWVKIEGTNTYTFTGLVSDTSYTVKVRAVNKDDYYTEESTTIKTKTIEMPTFSEKETDNGKTVTIVYPSGCGNGLTCTYQKDSGEWTTVSTVTQNVEFTKDGTLVAKVTDGINAVTTSSYTINLPLGKLDEIITNLVSTNTNELYTDNKGNIRYYGANPNNYVIFNNELWRIIGIIDGKVKIIINSFSKENAWSGIGYNNWTSSSIYTYLNNSYFDSIESVYQNMISEEIYYLGGPTSSNYSKLTASGYYDVERSNTVNGSNSKTVEQNIGLMYPSDYGYASGNNCANTYLYNFSTSCKNSNYLNKGIKQWTITHYATTSNYAMLINNSGSVDRLAFRVNSGGSVSYNSAYYYPALYLKANVNIVEGNGSQNTPYELS